MRKYIMGQVAELRLLTPLLRYGAGIELVDNLV